MRLNWVDSLKGLGIFLVIMGHLKPPQIVWLWIFSFHIPLFFFISGYVFNSKKYLDNPKTFVISRFKQLIIPYFYYSILTLIIVLISNYFYYNKIKIPLNYDISELFYAITYGVGNKANFDYSIINVPLWFLPGLFVTSIIFLCIFLIFNKSLHLFVFNTIFISVLGYVFIQFLPFALPWSFAVALSVIIFYASGYFFRSYLEDKFFKIADILILPLLLISFCSIGFNPTNINNWYYNANIFSFYLFAFAGILSMIYIVKRKNPSRIFSFYGKNTLIVFAIHGPLIGLTKRWITTPLTDFYDINPDMIVIKILIFVLVLIFSIPFIYARKYIKKKISKKFKTV